MESIVHDQTDSTGCCLSSHVVHTQLSHYLRTCLPILLAGQKDCSLQVAAHRYVSFDLVFHGSHSRLSVPPHIPPSRSPRVTQATSRRCSKQPLTASPFLQSDLATDTRPCPSLSMSTMSLPHSTLRMLRRSLRSSLRQPSHTQPPHSHLLTVHRYVAVRHTAAHLSPPCSVMITMMQLSYDTVNDNHMRPDLRHRHDMH